MSSWCFFCRSHRGVGPYGPEAKAPAWSLQAQLGAGEGAPSLFPPSADQGLPHPQLRKWHRPPTSHSDETPGRPKGKAAKQRAPEPPVFTHLSLARASMKIWCIFKGDTAIKWRENAPASVIPSPQRRTGVSELFQQNCNLPYISNPALAGFNCSLWTSLPLWPVSLITFLGNVLNRQRPSAGVKV